jgi:hypothetical protein
MLTDPARNSLHHLRIEAIETVLRQRIAWTGLRRFSASERHHGDRGAAAAQPCLERIEVGRIGVRACVLRVHNEQGRQFQLSRIMVREVQIVNPWSLSFQKPDV